MKNEKASSKKEGGGGFGNKPGNGNNVVLGLGCGNGHPFFWEWRISPGCLPAPRTPSSKSRCASHSRRVLMGKPLGLCNCSCTKRNARK